jgi:hypothetical protein
VQSDVNLRSGPGTDYEVVAAMPAGATVDVMGCQGTWCQVNFAGTPGFASRAYLGLGGGVAVGAAGPAYGEYDEGYVTSGPAYSTGSANYAYGGGSYYGGGYYGGGYYGTASVPTAREGRAFRAETREGVGLRAESREGVGLRAEPREGVGLRAESREGVNAGVREREGVSTRNTRSAEERSTEVGGNNPMINAKGSTAGSAAASSPRAEVRGNANARGGASANIRGNASGANASATTGGAPRGGEEDHGPNFLGPKAKDNH